MLFCNANRDTKQKKDPFTLGDFAPYLESDKKATTIIDLGEEENAKLIRLQIEAMMRKS